MNKKKAKFLALWQVENLNFPEVKEMITRELERIDKEEIKENYRTPLSGNSLENHLYELSTGL